MDDAPATLTAEDLARSLGALLAPGATGLVLAVSGGPDSMALMRVAAALRSMDRIPPLHVATVDHGLRPSAANDALIVEAAAKALRLPCRILRWDGDKPGARLQELAREARYRLLIAHCEAVGADHLATAHTLDDQAETVLFRLLRGSGPAGLAGIKPVSRLGDVRLVRPLLAVPKTTLEATCEAFGMPVCHDPANTDPRFARTRLRRLMPALAPEGGDAKVFGRLAARMARVDAALTEVAATAFTCAVLPGPAGALRLDMRHLARAPEEIAIRALAIGLASMGAGPSRLRRLERLVGLLVDHATARTPVAATLGGMELRLCVDGTVTITAETRRRSHAARPAAAPRPAFPWQA